MASSSATPSEPSSGRAPSTSAIPTRIAADREHAPERERMTQEHARAEQREHRLGLHTHRGVDRARALRALEEEQEGERGAERADRHEHRRRAPRDQEPQLAVPGEHARARRWPRTRSSTARSRARSPPTVVSFANAGTNALFTTQYAANIRPARSLAPLTSRRFLDRPLDERLARTRRPRDRRARPTRATRDTAWS